MPLPIVLAAGLGAWIGTKSIKIAALIAAMVTLTAALALVIGGSLTALYQSIPPEFALCIGMMPSNATVCLSALIVAAGARWVYDTHARILLAVVAV